MSILRIALPIPKRQLFDYLAVDVMPKIGARVRVSFGPRKLIGVVWEIGQESAWEVGKLKAIQDIIDDEPIFDETQRKLCTWLAQYYKHPIGDVVQSAMPVALRKGESSLPKPIEFYSATALGKKTELTSLSRAPKQQALLSELLAGDCLKAKVKEQFGAAASKALIDKGIIEVLEKQPSSISTWQQSLIIQDKPNANVEQALAISSIEAKLSEYACFLLDGITGSGKTEVYLQAIEPILQQGKQVLILVPEIGLTPQTVHRFRYRFGIDVGVLHSGLTNNERLLVWQKSAKGQLGIVIGTRSAIFTPMLNPGLLIVDEEHDASYKQQDGLRYHARDLAVVRAHAEQVPLILGSATPALETLNNALTGKYHHLTLHQRAGNASVASQQVFDIRQQPLKFGIAQGMLDRMKQHLQQGSQVMLFINRRGYAPALVCHQCGFVEQCTRCDKPFTLHNQLYKLQCHHCGNAKSIPSSCQQCHSTELTAMGVGTEQLEQGLTAYFPEFSNIRIDSDSARGKSKLDKMLSSINNNEHQILIGTQILSKGHHFPNVTMVLIMDVDGALFSADYRAAENLAQLITQLAGRAGRAEKPGEMWLQTHDPGHPLLQDLINNGYAHFAKYALLERQHGNLPPFTYQALFKAQALSAQDAHSFCKMWRSSLIKRQGVSCIGPIPALMEKRQGQYRMQLLLQSNQRSSLQRALGQQLNQIETLYLANKVRWSLDIDPQDFS
ncbi:primosomal protein N' [Paraglaciecola aquimarina]|uniref:Replication restart protein PriA n=1 Tax=Paraglaciecola aquimarina TaxID=1235557 RepID=A0ABU3SSM3_9ALTE|nr:primosomal protein N' [Paraglaciecola aquimarina]MDU0353021.1 primosomal protein N' [Paraglaciecola aquimarina]